MSALTCSGGEGNKTVINVEVYNRQIGVRLFFSSLGLDKAEWLEDIRKGSCSPNSWIHDLGHSGVKTALPRCWIRAHFRGLPSVAIAQW